MLTTYLKLINFIVIGALLTGTSMLQATEPTRSNAQQIFLNTENINIAPGQQGRLEVQSFKINSLSDLEYAKQQILNRQHNAQQFFKINIKTTDAERKTQLDISTENSLNEITQNIQAHETLPIQNIQAVTDSAQKSFFKRHYNTSLAVVRFVANSTTVTMGLVIGKHVSLEQAALVGILAGTMSAAIQLKSDVLFKWLNNSVYFVKTAKRIGLLPQNSNTEITRSERVIKEIETYSRWASVEAGFLAVCQTAMALMNIPITENLFVTTAKSTLSQGIFEVGILKTTQLLEQINPRWTEKASVFKNVSLFAGSGISVLAAIGSMIDMPYANLGFITLAASGIVLNFAPKLVKLKPIDKIIQRWRPRPLVLRCASLF